MTPIDKYFRSKLKNHVTEVPEILWDKIESQLPAPGISIVRRLAYAGLMTIMALTIILVVGITSDKSIESDLELSPIATETSGQNHDDILNLLTHNQVLFTENNTGSISPEDIQSAPIREASVASVSIKNTRNNISNSYILSVEDNAHLSNISSENLHFENEKSSDEATDDSTDTRMNENAVSMLTLAQNESKDHHLTAIPAIGIYELLSENINSNLLPGVKFNLNQQTCPSFSFEPSGFFADAYFSSDFNKKHLNSKAEQTNQYLLNRTNSEKPLYSFTAGFRVGYTPLKKIELMTGVEYKQINEKFEYIDPESNQTRLVTIKDYVYQNGKIIDSIITQEVIIIPGTVKYTVYNSFRSIDIPLIAGYNIFNQGRLNVNVSGGPVFNLTSLQRGMILSPDVDGKAIRITSDDEQSIQIYKQSTGISLSASVSIRYRLTKDMAIFAEPGIRTQLKSVTLDEYPLEQRFTTVGIAAGARYIF